MGQKLFFLNFYHVSAWEGSRVVGAGTKINPMILLNKKTKYDKIEFKTKLVFLIVSSSVFLVFGFWRPDLAIVACKFGLYTIFHP